MQNRETEAWRVALILVLKLRVAELSIVRQRAEISSAYESLEDMCLYNNRAEHLNRYATLVTTLSSFTEEELKSNLEQLLDDPRVVPSAVGGVVIKVDNHPFVRRGDFHYGDIHLAVVSHPKERVSIYVEEGWANSPIQTHLHSLANGVEQAVNNLDLLSMAYEDHLTGLANRRRIDAQLTLEVARWRRGSPFSLLYVDLDHFKECNDQYGHPFGDLVLKRVAETLLRNIRETDIVGRVGGDEFMILQPSTNKEQARIAANHILKAIRRNRLLSEHHVTCSIGIRSLPAREDDDTTPTKELVSSIIETADEALYKAKEAGRDQIATFE